MRGGAPIVDRRPEEWTEATDAQKRIWAAQARLILKVEGIVPENSVHSLAVAWNYHNDGGASWNATRTIPGTAGAGSPKEV